MCTLRGIPALLTSCSWNIVFILTVNSTHIKYRGMHKTCEKYAHIERGKKSLSEPWMEL